MQTMSNEHEKAKNYANEAYQFFETKAYQNYKTFMDQQKQENSEVQ